MILSRCYECCHEEICSYKKQYYNAIESVADISYATGEAGKRELLKDSLITVEFKCPHYLSKNGGEE